MKKNIFVILPILLIIKLNVLIYATQIQNDFLDIRVADNTEDTGNNSTIKVKGRFVIGNSSGQRLLYGYPEGIWSSKTTIKIDSPTSVLTTYGSPESGFLVNPTIEIDANGNTSTYSVWKINDVEITQRLTIVENPRTSRNKDTAEIKYTIKNTGSQNVLMGIRVMLDTMLGSEDNSPIMVSGEGRITREKEWTGPSIPDAWLTVDDIYSPNIKAEGILSLKDATPPDRLIIGYWGNMSDNLWTYTLNTYQDISDTAVSIFWENISLTPSETKTFITYYGLPDISGAELDILKSVDKIEANYGDTLSYTLTYSNTGDYSLSNLYIWDTIPLNTEFVDASTGYNFNNNVISWFLGDITDTLTSYTLWFRTRIKPLEGLNVINSAKASYIDNYWNEAEVKYSNNVITNILTATITPTSTITPTHSITPTSTITLTPTPTPPPLVFKHIGAYPNPAKSYSNIIFNLTRHADIRVNIFTVSGEKVKTFFSHFNKGYNVIKWDLKNNSSKDVSSGIYIYIIEAFTERNEYTKSYGKIVVVK